MDVVQIGRRSLTIDELGRVAAGAPVKLHHSAVERIGSARAVVDKALAGGLPVYGLNTGVGHLKDTRLPDEMICQMQVALLHMHEGGVGEPAPREVVRSAMAVRLNGLAQGGSGASLRVAEVLVAMLNAGVHPVVPRHGSVGAADLGQMAAIALVVIGEGRAEYGGVLLPGAEALRRAGIAPAVAQPKDALALVSSNGISLGFGALVALRAARVAAAADLAAALSMEAVRANPSVFHPAVAAAKPYAGHIAAARSLESALRGSYLLEQAGPRSIQDPLSFRVVPQVHGALREFLGSARAALELELNSVSDNPMVAVDEGRMIHNGNFHPIVPAISFDALRIALAHVGQLSERRMEHLWQEFFRLTEAPDSPPPNPTSEFFGLSLRYAAAAQLAELKQLAAPATLDVPPLETEVEDHATAAPLSVRKADEALDLLESLLTTELLLARDVLSLFRPPPKLGTRTGATLSAVDGALSAITEDRSVARVHESVREVVRSLPGAVD